MANTNTMAGPPELATLEEIFSPKPPAQDGDGRFKAVKGPGLDSLWDAVPSFWRRLRDPSGPSDGKTRFRTGAHVTLNDISR